MYRLLALLFLAASMAYLLYEVLSYDSYPLLWEQLQVSLRKGWPFLIITLALLPLNWLTEAWKWRYTLSKLHRITLGQSLKGVLAGAATGFVTPNRLGDIAGRMLQLPVEKRTQAVSLAAVNSLSQNLAILLPALPLAVLFFAGQKQDSEFPLSTWLWILAGILLLTNALLYLLPTLLRKIRSPRISRYLEGVQLLGTRQLTGITLLALLRFVIFNLQLWALLTALGVSLTATQALLSLPVSYLFVTFTPSFALSEGVVRGSWLLYFVGQFSSQAPAILSAAIILWIINIILPSLIGNLLLWRQANRR